MAKARGDIGNPAGVAEERLNGLLRLASECYWETDESHRFAVIAGAALESAGFDARRDIGKAYWESDAIPVADYFNRPVSAEHFAELLRVHAGKGGGR